MVFVWLVFGHLFGDFMFQNNWMAINKKSHILPCLVHCTIYTTIVCLFLYLGAGVIINWLYALLIFLSHIILDGTHLVDRWMVFYGIRSWDTGLTKTGGLVDWEELITSKTAVQTSFGAVVYVVLDNTLHLFFMLLILKYMGAL